MLRRICLMSCFFGTVINLIQEKGTKQITEILCTCILIISIIEPFTGCDPNSFSLALAKYNENEKRLTETAYQINDELNREVIEREYSAYILEKAEKSGVLLESVQVSAKDCGDGIWLPWETYIEYKENGVDMTAISDIIESELGIPKERQRWTN